MCMGRLLRRTKNTPASFRGDSLCNCVCFCVNLQPIYDALWRMRALNFYEKQQIEYQLRQT